MPRFVLPLLCLAALTFFAGIGRGVIADSDEAFYAEAAREMVESGDWITPHYNYEYRFQKPIFYYWLTAATYLVTGPGEAAARLWSAAAGLGLALITAGLGRRWFGDRVALLAGAITATNFGYFALSRMALPDLPLAFFITATTVAALLAWLEDDGHRRRWLVLAALACACGVLTKGPIAIVVPGLVVTASVVTERRWRAVGPADLAVAAVVFTVVAVPWYVAMWLRHGNLYLESFFLGDNLERFATDRFNDPRPWWFYLPVIAGGLLPWTPLALLWVGPAFAWVRRRRPVEPMERRLLLWALLPLLFFTASIGKQPRYVLPVLPPLAILLAVSIEARLGAATAALRDRRLVVGGVLSGLFLIVLGLLINRAQPVLINVDDLVTTLAVVPMVLGGIVVTAISLSSRWRRAPAAIAVTGALSLACLPYAVISSVESDAVTRVAALVGEARTGNERIAAYGVFVRNLVFYARVPHEAIVNEEQLREFLASPSRVLAVLPVEVLDRLAVDRDLPLDRIAELAYFNPSALRVGRLLFPEPARDIERVVLVANHPAGE